MHHIKLSHELLEQLKGQGKPLVVIESPLSSPTIEGWVRNKKFARACMRDSLARGEAPYASHLIYAQEGILDDDVADERALGMYAGFVWGDKADYIVCYDDLGISSGMAAGLQKHRDVGKRVEVRTLGYIPEVLPEEVELEKMRRVVAQLLKNEEVEVDLGLGMTV